MARSKYHSGDLSKTVMCLFFIYWIVDIYNVLTSNQMHVAKVQELSEREKMF